MYNKKTEVAIPAMPTLELIQNFFPPEKRRTQSVRSFALILQNFIGAPDLERRLEAFVEL